MADVNYSNPSSLDPGVGFKPDGFLGGMEWQKRNQMFTDAQSLQDLLSRNSAIKSNMETKEFQQDSPIRAAQGQALLNTANATSNTIGRTKEAGLQDIYARSRHNNAMAGGAELKNSEAEQTSIGRVAAETAKQALEVGAAGVAGLQNQVKTFQALMPMLQLQGPQAAANNARLLSQAGVPQAAVQKMIGNGSPQVMAKNMKDFMDMLLLSDTHAQGELAKQRLHNEGNLAVQGSANAGHLELQKAKEQAKSKSALDILKAVKTPGEAQMKAAMIYNDPDVDMHTKILAKQVYDRATEQLKNTNAVKTGPGISPSGITPPATNYSPLESGSSSGEVVQWERKSDGSIGPK